MKPALVVMGFGPAALLGLLMLGMWPQGLKIPGNLESGIKMCNKPAATIL